MSLIGYFAYHLLEGDRSLSAWARLNGATREAKAQLQTLEAERQVLERRVAGLSGEHIDGDLLDEEARRTLNLIGPNEIIIYDPRPHSRQ